MYFMKLLFIGDVVGKVGSEFLSKKLYSVKKQYGIDVTVVNGENSAQGNGLTRQSAEFLFSNGADVITTGNHCFRRKEIMGYYDTEEYLIRPANYPEGAPGKGYCILDFCDCKVAVVNLMGTAYMEPLDNPFTTIDNILEEIDTPNIFVDFHAEATAEKKCMGYYLAGRATAVLGTHTHVQTADECILNEYTAYITDVGMTGPIDSVLGVRKDEAIKKMITHLPVMFQEADSPCQMGAIVIDFDKKLGKTNKIERISIF